MKIQDIRKIHSKKDAFSTLSLLNCVLKFVGLSCIYRDEAKLKYRNPIWKFILYLVFFFSLNVYSVYFKINNDNGDVKFTFRDSFQLTYIMGYIQYIFDIIYVYKYGRQSYLNYFNLYDVIDSILGVVNIKEIRKCVIKMCLFYTSIGIMVVIIELYTWVINLDWLLVNIYSVEVLYLGIKLLAVLDIVSNYTQIKYRMEAIGDLLENYYHGKNSPGILKNAIWISQEISKFNNYDSQTISNGCHDIPLRLSRSYVLLLEQCDFINLKYGIRLLISCSMYLMDMVLLTNLLIRVSLGTTVFPNTSSYLVCLSTLARMLAYTVVLFCGTNLCEQNYRQRERIMRIIDHILIDKKIPKGARETFRELKEIVTSRPIDFHAFNFFRLDLTTLVSMASVIVTYTIIFLQNVQ